jgi:hypothetical protein
VSQVHQAQTTGRQIVTEQRDFRPGQSRPRSAAHPRGRRSLNRNSNNSADWQRPGQQPQRPNGQPARNNRPGSQAAAGTPERQARSRRSGKDKAAPCRPGAARARGQGQAAARPSNHRGQQHQPGQQARCRTAGRGAPRTGQGDASLGGALARRRHSETDRPRRSPAEVRCRRSRATAPQPQTPSRHRISSRASRCGLLGSQAAFQRQEGRGVGRIPARRSIPAARNGGPAAPRRPSAPLPKEKKEAAGNGASPHPEELAKRNASRRARPQWGRMDRDASACALLT